MGPGRPAPAIAGGRAPEDLHALPMLAGRRSGAPGPRRGGTGPISFRGMGEDFETVIGLECHVELSTATKMFCGCRNEFGAPPNSNVCPVCLGQPGTLPPRRQMPEPFAASSSVDPAEVAQFSALAAEFWDPRGKMRMLHRINPIRLLRSRANRKRNRTQSA